MSYGSLPEPGRAARTGSQARRALPLTIVVYSKFCHGMAVRDVVAHVTSYDELDARGLLAHVVRGRSGRIRSTPLPWPDTTRAPGATAGVADGSPAALRAAGGAGRPGCTRLSGD